MAIQGKANTAEVRCGASKVFAIKYHISLFVDKFDADGNLAERYEITAVPEHNPGENFIR